MSELNLNEIKKLSGDETKKLFKKYANFLISCKLPLYFTGPSGSGKTAISLALAKWYAEKMKVKAYYVQLSPDMTKTSLILGLRLVNGSLIPMNGIVANAMEEGGIIIVDECTHASQELLLMFNGILDRTSITSVGDKTIIASDKFRIIFCSNNSNYAGNNKIPQSFAQRLITYNFNYPSEEEEVVIAKKMLKDDLGECAISNATIKYVTSLVREIRTDSYPLSVRNIANSIVLMQLSLTEKTQEELEFEIERINDSNAESKVRTIYKRIYNKELRDLDTVFDNIYIKQFYEDVANVGLNEFKESILSACMYYIDVEGFGIDIMEIKQKLKMLILD
ncbi:MAG: AAA family ATPase [Acidithiobacillus sp.]|jgi:hypothetical protein|uniref:AAA family ATPase n=1 Tax=Acidithiobacillus sp. TaxID=1872118 RepID=UPI00355E968A